ncbi:MAG: copper resistance protein B [Bdellovibrionales bacterium]|nr:copper resistance protein B [Bdellovibrionales bacterium]
MISIIISFILSPLIAFAALSDPKAESKIDWPTPVTDSEQFGLLLFDLLEYKPGSGSGSLNWDIIGWRGGDTHRLWIKSEGSAAVSSPKSAEADFQLLYGRLVSPFFDLQLGVRLEQVWGDQRANRLSAVIGLQGLALYFFELESALFIGEAGQLAGRLTATKDFLFTQKLISQLRIETNGATKRSGEFQTGSGINDFALGLRLRYEIQREVAPYIGISWSNLFGETAEYRRLVGIGSSEWNVVSGLRMWY